MPRGFSVIRRIGLAGAIVGATANLSLGAQPAPPTIRQLSSAPFPSAMRASPAGDMVAWVQNAEGARSIWLATAPAFEGRAITTFPGDFGQEVSELAFSHDGRTLWFTVGSGSNRAGEFPKPGPTAVAAEQAIYRLKLDSAGAQPQRVAEGSRPTPSPTSPYTVFLRRGQVMKIDPAGQTRGPEPMFYMRGAASDLRWSPDGKHLAVVSNRGTHAFVGVLDIAGKDIQWMDPSTDTDQSPVWSPDSKQLAFIRVPYEPRRMLFTAVRTAQPWSIHVADASSGRARKIFTASEGMGSVFWPVQAESQLIWSTEHRLVFPWERDGFLHLYSMPASGGQWTQLDSGAHEVEYVAYDRATDRVYANSNMGIRDLRRIIAVSPQGGGGPINLMTHPNGIDWMPTPLKDGSVAYLGSTDKQPARAMLWHSDYPARALAPQSMPGDFPVDRLVSPTAVSFRASDGVTSYGQLFLPPAHFTGKRPTAVFLHGGSRRQMLRGWNYGSYYHHAYAMNQALALRGWVVLSLNYRSGIGYGQAFREALDYGAGGGSEYRDLVAATGWLRTRPDVDTTRIALWGGSYGGYLTAMGLTRHPEWYAAGVDIHGVHDWNVGIQTFQPGYNPLDDPVASKRAFDASPMAQVRRWKDPVLLIHGDDDRNVRFIESLTLIQHLRAQRVPVEQLVLPDEVHGFLRHESWMRVFETSLDFLDRWVVKKP